MERIGELLNTFNSQENFPPTIGTNSSVIPQTNLQSKSEATVVAPPDEVAQPLSEIWAHIRKTLEARIGAQLFFAWIAPLELRSVKRSGNISETQGFHAQRIDHVATLVAPNRFCSEHVQQNYSEIIRGALVELGYSLPQLVFQIEKGQIEKGQIEKATKERRQAQKFSSGTRRRLEAENAQPLKRDETCLNPKYNFSNFVVGSCNQLAHAVGLKISEDLGQAYNPLFLYGGVGLGKTHLANAIGNSARRRQKKVLLVSSEAFVSELIASLRSNRMDQFKNKFRTLDLLIIDDIQFIIGKERTQEEFFHTFNDLYNRHKQIVITSDKVPQELVGLEDRLKTRFASGLSVDLQAPDFETRVAILSKKAEVESVDLPEEVSRFVAERIDTNVRELEGALNQLRAVSALQKSNITLLLAEEVLKNFGKRRTLDISSEAIQRAVAERFNVSLNDLLGKRRTQNIALARQVAMYLCRKLTAYSFPEIGAFFGGRDHSTVIHAQRMVKERIGSDGQLRDEVLSLEKQFRNL